MIYILEGKIIFISYYCKSNKYTSNCKKVSNRKNSYYYKNNIQETSFILYINNNLK